MNQADDEMILSLLQQQRWSDTAEAARRRLADDPHAIMALFALATSLRELGASETALDAYAKLAALEPDDPAHWHNLASLHRELGQMGPAEFSYSRALQYAPHQPELLLDAGLLALEDSRLADARNRLATAVTVAPNWAPPRIFLARCYAELCEDEQVLLCLDPLMVQDLAPELQLELGSLFAQIGDTGKAREHWEKALAFPLSELRAEALLVGLHERLNELEAASHHLEKLPDPSEVMDLVVRQDILQARASMAARNFRKWQAIADYRALLALPLNDATRARVGFDMGRLLVEQAGCENEAIEVLSQAHSVQVSSLHKAMPEYTASPPEPLTLGLADPSSAWCAASTQGHLDPSDAPVFVVGFPRSGTTLLEQMLDAHPQLVSMDERTFVQDAIDDMRELYGLEYPQQLAMLNEDAIHDLRARYWKRAKKQVAIAPGVRLVDKNPLNIMRLPIMFKLFPNAKFILALRHPCDVLLSCYMQNFRSPIFQYLCRSLPDIAQAYANTMRGWVNAANCFRPDCMTLRYEDLLDDFPGVAKQLASFIGVENAEPMLQYYKHAKRKGYISTPSYAQVVQPPVRTAAGRWQRFAPAFDGSLPILKPWLEHWGYAAP